MLYSVLYNVIRWLGVGQEVRLGGVRACRRPAVGLLVYWSIGSVSHVGYGMLAVACWLWGVGGDCWRLAVVVDWMEL